MARPYTIRFGPWSPDLQDVGVEMPSQWTATELPCADVLNVYWQDASYRCLPAPASIGPSLGTPILDAFTWYDNTQGKEVIFAATANGFSTLIDGTWTAIPIETTESVVGLSISLQLGSVQGLATAMSPTSESASGSGSSYTFPALSAVIGYGTASSYSWSFTGQTGPGTWSIASGQGTANAVPEVTGSAAGSTSTATAVCTIVFGGYSYGVTSALSYTQTSFAPVLHTYTSGSGTETVPTGATTLTIEIWGGGGGGNQANGGGGGGYSRSVYAVSSGQTLSYSVGAGSAGHTGTGSSAAGSSTVTSGSLSITTMTANGGNQSGSGVGGTAGGGNQLNATGGTGVTSGAGGSTTAGIYANTGPTNGVGGAYGVSVGSAGAAGEISFRYS